MRWERTTIILRLICRIFGIGSLVVEWYLTKIGSSGIEDVPPPFILLAFMRNFMTETLRHKLN